MKQTRLQSFQVASAGFLHASRTQANFQIQLLASFFVIVAAAFLNFSRMEWVVLIITIGLVLTMELLNTVIEVVVDLAVKEQLLPEAKIAKDVAAAAVLLMSFISVVIGLFLFIPHLY